MMRWLPEDVSTYGREIDALFFLIYYITAATFILVTALMIWFLWKVSRSRKPPRDLYSWQHDAGDYLDRCPGGDLNRALFMSVSTWAKVEREVPPTDFEVSVSRQTI